MSSIGQYHNLLPEPITSQKGRKNNFATAVRNVLFLTRTIPRYEKITYKQFVENFPELVKLTESEDDPYLYYTSGEKKGQLKEVNLDTLRDTWVKRYNFNDDFAIFKKKVAYEVAKNVMQDTILAIPEENKQDDEIFDETVGLQRQILNSFELSEKDKAYGLRACQDTKNGITLAKNTRQDQAKDYINIIDEYNEIASEEETRVIPTIDNPPWGNSDLAFERDKELREVLFRKREMKQ